MFRILVLSLAPFAFATGAYAFAGLLEPMASDLGVSVAVVAQLQTAFMIACGVGGPVLAIATASVEKRTLLLLVLVILAAANALSAMTSSFWQLSVIRTFAGFVGALTVPVASMLAVMLILPERRSVALAAILGGNSLAFLFGIPLGSVIGSVYGWAASFGFSACLCLFVATLTYLFIPKSAAPPLLSAKAYRVILQWPVPWLLGVTLLAFTATFATVGLIGPVVTAATGLSGGSIGLMQLLIGVGSVVGLFAGARLAGKSNRPLPWLLAGILATQCLYIFSLSGGYMAANSVALIATALLAGSACLFACAPIIQTRLASVAGPAATVAFAFNGSMIFMGQGLGTAAGGIATAQFGLWSVGLTGALIAAMGLALSLRDLTPKTTAEPAMPDGAAQNRTTRASRMR